MHEFITLALALFTVTPNQKHAHSPPAASHMVLCCVCLQLICCTSVHFDAKFCKVCLGRLQTTNCQDKHLLYFSDFSVNKSCLSTLQLLQMKVEIDPIFGGAQKACTMSLKFVKACRPANTQKQCASFDH